VRLQDGAVQLLARHRRCVLDVVLASQARQLANLHLLELFEMNARARQRGVARAVRVAVAAVTVTTLVALVAAVMTALAMATLALATVPVTAMRLRLKTLFVHCGILFGKEVGVHPFLLRNGEDALMRVVATV